MNFKYQPYKRDYDAIVKETYAMCHLAILALTELINNQSMRAWRELHIIEPMINYLFEVMINLGR